jgi:hypothetical protein
MREALKTILCVVSLSGLSGCAMNIPNMGDVGATRKERELGETSLIAHVQCELRDAVIRVRTDYERDSARLLAEHPESKYNSIDWLKNWGVTVTMEFQVQAKAKGSPGISVEDPLANVIKTFPTGGDVKIDRARTAGFGVNFGRDITRTEKISFFYSFAGWERFKAPLGDCKPIDIVADNDLKIYDFLHSKIWLAQVPNLLVNLTPPPEPPKAEPGQEAAPPVPPVTDKPPVPPKVKAPYSTLTYDVNFIVTEGASATFGWKLVRIGVNPNEPLFEGSRTRGNHLLLTFGEVKDDGASEEAKMQHFASLIGQSVRGTNP